MLLWTEHKIIGWSRGGLWTEHKIIGWVLGAGGLEAEAAELFGIALPVGGDLDA